MADLTSSSLTSRPVPPTEAAGRVGRVVSPTAAASDHAASQQHDPQTEGRQAPREDTLRAGHHDPAVTLAATLAQVETGALLAAALQGLNNEGRPVATAGTTQYLIDADPQLLPRMLSALAEASNATILVASVDRTITALLIAVDGKPLPTSLPVTLNVLMTDPGAEGIEPPPNVTQVATVTYRPAPTFARPEDMTIDTVFLPTTPLSHGAPHGSAPMETTAAFPLDSQSRPRVTGSLPLLTVAPADPLQPPAPQMTIATFPSVLLPLQPSENNPYTPPMQQTIGTPPRPVIVTITPLMARPTATPTPAATLLLQDMTQDLPGVIDDLPVNVPSKSSVAGALQVIRTTLGAIPLPPDLELPRDTAVMVRLTPASSALAGPPVETGITSAGADTTATHVPALSPTSAIGPLAARPTLITPWPADTLPEPHQPWPLMQSLLSATAIDPAFSAALVSKLPSPERPINPAFLLFLNLLGVSSPAKLLLGPGGDTWFRQNDAEEMLTRLHNGIEQLKRVAADRAAGEWRPFVIPFHNPQNPQGIESILMLVRHSPADPNQDQSQSDAAPDNNNGRVTRFVLDLQLSHLGTTQIDGIIQEKTFNLAVRTERPLATPQEQDLRGIFTLALERNSFKGDISFRCGLPFPIDGAREWHAALQAGSSLSA